MTLIVELKPEVQAELSRQADSHGIDVSAYAASLLEKAADVGHEDKTLTPERLERFLKGMAQFSHKIPSLPDEAFSRESIYQDHD